MGLREYQRKRDFKKTAEPPPKKGTRRGGALFVIQKHAASRLHYDFRLEMDGVLKSWAVPKGVPFSQGDKRLAVQVEDHPLDYARFEGVIPEGEYGGGTVMVWEIGQYEVSGDNPERALKEGKLHLSLHGGKLEGEWTLVRTRGGESGKENWLLMKTGESAKPVSKKKDDESALSGRTMKQIAAARDREWHSNREPEKPAAPAAAKKTAPRTPKTPRKTAASRNAPEFICPMKPKLVARPPTGEQWVSELKFDGYRAIAVKDGGKVTLFSRNEKPFDFPEVAEAVASLPCETAVLDGEVVALDETGHPSFQLLQARELGEPAPICYYLFDLLDLDGEALLRLPLLERKNRLAQLLRESGDPLRFSASLSGEPGEVLKQVKARALEGIVAKRADSPYEPGLRTGAWVKVKCVNEQEMVIGGYTEPKGTRPCFGALLLGYFEGKKLKFAGKVGTGFNDRLLKTLYRQFQESRIPDCPFADLPSKSAGRWNQGITPSEMRRCTWLRPELVCRVKFSQWTHDGKLRQGVFLGMRTDKPAAEVTQEIAR